MRRSQLAVRLTVAFLLCVTCLAIAARIEAAPSRSVVDTLAVPGGHIYYEVQGKGRVVVLLHAAGTDSKMWDEQFSVLAKRFRVIRYDQRGWGRSSKPEKPFHPVDDLSLLLRHLKVKRASLVGLSMGSGVALNFALEYPKMVEKLVLVSMSGPPPNLPPGAQLALTKGPPIFERLGAVAVPTFIMLGEKDGERVQEMAEKLAKEIPRSRKVKLSGAGHLINSEQPEAFNRALIDFLRE
jgi:pimeloyl-ACP methyl ester carboxylesterase